MSIKENTLRESFIPLEATETIFKTISSLKDKTISHSITFNDLPVKPTLICFSHLRWDFVFQRPQHLFTRFAKQLDVIFVEEPIFDRQEGDDFVSAQVNDERITVLTPHLAPGSSEHHENTLSVLLENYLSENRISDLIAWYYTPMALGFTHFLKPLVTVYDCMDELTAFAGAPAELKEREARLFKKADLVFTGGISLYEAKKNFHEHVYPFPSSIELEHFMQARNRLSDPVDQLNIGFPRIGFFGVIDERMDIDLISEVAELKKEWHFIFIGPIVKINPDNLPRLSNIHYLGMKAYKELPSYISNWNIAMLPFALNEATRFISPTKTPEYLASGRPVVSSAIKDVVKSYGAKGLVNVFENVQEFITSVETALKQEYDKDWLKAVDEELAKNSWNLTAQKMVSLIANRILNSQISNHKTHLS
jgi:glycosyltransferase involved in cell wall biosynthesis